MTKIDSAEKASRTVLWLVLAGVAVSIPIEQAARDKKEREVAEKLSQEAKAATKAKRLEIKGLSPFMQSVNYTTGRGIAEFTNVSANAGYVCVTGTVKNVNGGSSTSLPGCGKLDAFSSVQVEVSFAGSELVNICPNGAAGCTASFQEAPASFATP